ncbi:hypothetical protein ACQRET_03525 [Streptomyces koyangensis]|uniref:hypothetical protein n=1 Tax=Streptomyces koyangensis TaxID=188770 RepID=UPI003D00D80C
MTTHPEADEARIRSLLIAAGVGPLADHHTAPDTTVDADPAPNNAEQDDELGADDETETDWRVRLLRLTERIEERAGVAPPTPADADEDQDDEDQDDESDEDQGDEDEAAPTGGANRMPDWRTGAHIDLTKPQPDDADDADDDATAKVSGGGGTDDAAEDDDQDDDADEQDDDAEADPEAGLPWWQRTAGRLERKAGVEPPVGTEPPHGPGGSGGGDDDTAGDDAGDDDPDPAAKKTPAPSGGGGAARFWPSWGSGRRPKFDAPGLHREDRRSVLDIIRSTPRHVWWLLYSGSAAAVGWHFGWPQWVSDGLRYLETTQASWTTAYCLTCYVLAAGVLAADVATRTWFYPLAWAVRVLSASLVLGFLLWGDPTPISDLVNSSERTPS